MQEKVISFLTELGVEVLHDDPLLPFIIQNVTQAILNETNQPVIPAGLETVAVYMAAGQYLNLKKGTGQLEGFDLEAAVKQIQEGDTSISFAVGDGSMTPEQRLDRLISYLTDSGAGQFTAYRRLKW